MDQDAARRVADLDQAADGGDGQPALAELGGILSAADADGGDHGIDPVLVAPDLPINPEMVRNPP